MDILRKELNAIYDSQGLDSEVLSPVDIERCKLLAEGLVCTMKGCAVITDASCDHCYLYIGSTGELLGITGQYPVAIDIDSSDEDIIYSRIHPEDLVEKRMLEYEFFKQVDPMVGNEKLEFQATCKIRIKDSHGSYRVLDNTTQVICPSPSGKIWLILCTYVLSSDQRWTGSIFPTIKNNHTGQIISLSFIERRKHVLTEREKEILACIKEGKASKQIAYLLGISIHTVNRHRQNILEKLSVANSIEAITAAEAMRLL